MIISVTRAIEKDTVKVESDCILNEDEIYFIKNYLHVLPYNYEFTLLDFVIRVLDNYKGNKVNSLIYSVIVKSGYASTNDYAKIVKRIERH